MTLNAMVVASRSSVNSMSKRKTAVVIFAGVYSVLAILLIATYMWFAHWFDYSPLPDSYIGMLAFFGLLFGSFYLVRFVLIRMAFRLAARKESLDLSTTSLWIAFITELILIVYSAFRVWSEVGPTFVDLSHCRESDGLFTCHPSIFVFLGILAVGTFLQAIALSMIPKIARLNRSNITICPTVTAESVGEYDDQVHQLESFAERVHLDFMDGAFAPSKSPDLSVIKPPSKFLFDLHVMYQNPQDYLKDIIHLKPHLVVVHAESTVDYKKMADELHRNGIKFGIALLQKTPVKTVAPLLGSLDHVLVFSGNLGYQGGSKVDVHLVTKVKELRKLKPKIEIGWDGGVNDKNIKFLATVGVNVINVGGFIQKSDNPKAAYQKLEQALL